MTERPAVELIQHADTAMYRAKAGGRGLVVPFDAEMGRDQHERSLIERELRQALTNHELEVWFQPRFENQVTTYFRVRGVGALAPSGTRLHLARAISFRLPSNVE